MKKEAVRRHIKRGGVSHDNANETIMAKVVDAKSTTQFATTKRHATTNRVYYHNNYTCHRVNLPMIHGCALEGGAGMYAVDVRFDRNHRHDVDFLTTGAELTPNLVHPCRATHTVRKCHRVICLHVKVRQ